MSKFRLTILAFCVALGVHVQAQDMRINTYEQIGWYNVFTTVDLPKNFGVHAEYQWRRVDYGKNWEQSLLRAGVNYKFNPRVLFRLGYAWIETFSYGELPINVFGKDFTEHRIFQMAQLAHKEGRLDISHRFMFEQRFVGKYSHADQIKEDAFRYMNRARYMLRLQMPLNGTEIKDKTAYAAVYDELFIGFGKNVNANVFDQNRTGILLGYRFNKNLRIEAGYLKQTLQFSRMIEGKNVFQHNNGIIVNANINLDFTEKRSKD